VAVAHRLNTIVTIQIIEDTLMPTTVTFCINTSSDVCVSEDELATDLKRHRVAILADEERQGAMNGALIIRSPGASEIRVADEIEGTVARICFFTVPELLVNKHVVLRHFSYPGYFRLDPEGLKILVSGDYVPSVRVDYREFILALAACGERFIAFLRRLIGDTEDGAARVKVMDEAADVARQALRDAGDIVPRPG